MTSAALPAHERADLAGEAERARAVDRGHAQRRRRGECRGVAGDVLAEQRGRLHLGEHIESVVAGGAVGAERDVDAGVRAAARRGTARSRASGSSAGNARRSRRPSPAARSRAAVSCVACTPIKLGVTRPSAASRASGRRPVAATASATSAAVSCTCMCIGPVELVGEAANVRERRVVDAVGSVRRERRRDQRLGLEAIVDLEALAQVLVRALGPRRREVERDHAEHGAHAGLGCHGPR